MAMLDITGPGKEKGFIFQEHRLFPWLTVEKNIAADLSLRDPESQEKVDELIEIVRLTGFEKSYPRELSGEVSAKGSDSKSIAQRSRGLTSR